MYSIVLCVLALFFVGGCLNLNPLNESNNLIRCIDSEEDKAMTPEEKLERNRIRNRDHSRRSRQRKKALLEGMKNQV